MSTKEEIEVGWGVYARLSGDIITLRRQDQYISLPREGLIKLYKKLQEQDAYESGAFT